MYNNYSMYQGNDDRLIGGGFLGPFILGGITGGLINRPNYYYPYPPAYFPPRPYPPRPYPGRPYPGRPPRW